MNIQDVIPLVPDPLRPSEIAVQIAFTGTSQKYVFTTIDNTQCPTHNGAGRKLVFNRLLEEGSNGVHPALSPEGKACLWKGALSVRGEDVNNSKQAPEEGKKEV